MLYEHSRRVPVNIAFQRHPETVLSEHAVDPRYPGKFATVDETAHAMRICVEVRRAVREQLKLPIDATDD